MDTTSVKFTQWLSISCIHSSELKLLQTKKVNLYTSLVIIMKSLENWVKSPYSPVAWDVLNPRESVTKGLLMEEPATTGAIGTLVVTGLGVSLATGNLPGSAGGADTVGVDPEPNCVAANKLPSPLTTSPLPPPGAGVGPGAGTPRFNGANLKVPGIVVPTSFAMFGVTGMPDSPGYNRIRG